MSKIENKIKSYYENELRHDTHYQEICEKAGLIKKERNIKGVFFMKKTSLKIIGGVLLLALVVGVGIGIGVGVKNKTNMQSVVTMNLNPSITLTLDKEGKVSSVNGNNDEGKMIVQDETLVGLDYEDAINLIVTVETNCGYFVKGNCEADANHLSISIETNLDKAAEKLATDITATVNKKCEELGVKISNRLEVEKTTNHDALVKRAMELDPTLIQEVANEMSSEKLVLYIQSYQLERATLPTEEIVELYNKVKEYQVTIAEDTVEKNVIEPLNAIIGAAFDLASQTLTTAMKSLQDMYESLFVSTTSIYQQSYDSLKEQKAKVLKARQDLANSTEEDKEAKEADLALAESTLDTLQKSLDSIKTSAKSTLDKLETAITSAQTKLLEFKNKLTTDIQAALTSSAKEIDTAINTAKNNAISDFEKNYKSDIEATYNSIKAYKASLIEQMRTEAKA